MTHAPSAPSNNTTHDEWACLRVCWPHSIRVTILHVWILSNTYTRTPSLTAITDASVTNTKQLKDQCVLGDTRNVTPTHTPISNKTIGEQSLPIKNTRSCGASTRHGHLLYACNATVRDVWDTMRRTGRLGCILHVLSTGHSVS